MKALLAVAPLQSQNSVFEYRLCYSKRGFLILHLIEHLDTFGKRVEVGTVCYHDSSGAKNCANYNRTKCQLDSSNSIT